MILYSTLPVLMSSVATKKLNQNASCMFIFLFTLFYCSAIVRCACANKKSEMVAIMDIYF